MFSNFSISFTSKPSQLVLTVLISLLFTITASASGGSTSVSGNSTNKTTKIDQNYEAGKSIYNGRSNAGSINYCLKSGDEVAEVNATNISSFKRATVSDFSASLISCDEGNELASSLMSSDDFLLVVYYLSKRYNLYLANS